MASPFVVCSPEQLARVGAYLSSSFEAHADIDAAATNPASVGNPGSTWDNGGLGFAPIGDCGPDAQCETGDDVPFTGTFNGLDHTIANLYIYRPTQAGVGLFGKASGPDVSVQRVRLAEADVTGGTNVGAAVGRLDADLTRCASSGTVTGTSLVGGLVGQMGMTGGPGAVRKLVQSSSSCAVAGISNVGGLIGGLEWGAELHESFATGFVSATQAQAGGLVGYSYSGAIQDCYAAGFVAGQDCVGGLLGFGDFSTNTNVYATGLANGTTRVGEISGCQGNTMTSGVFAATKVLGASMVGGLYGEKWGGNIVNSYWFGGGGRPSVMCGSNRPSEPGLGCDDSFIITGSPSYLYSPTNPPLSSWSTSVWAFHADRYPTLANTMVISGGAGGGGGAGAGGSGGATTGSGGATMGSGGATMGSGGATTGSGGISSGADGGAPEGGESGAGAGEAGSSESGGTSNGGTSNGGTSSGGTSSGGTSNGGTSNGGTSNGGTSNGGTSNGGTSNGGTSNGGTSNAGSGAGGLEPNGCSCRSGAVTPQGGDWGWLLGTILAMLAAARRRASLLAPSNAVSPSY